MMFAFLALAIAAAVPTGPALSQVTESQLIRPVAGGTLTQEQVRAVAPVYTLTPHTIPTPDGARLNAVLLRQPNARGTVIYFGGNGYLMERFGAETAALFAPLGVNLVLVDHRGYGRSTGKPTADLLAADGLTVFDFVRRMKGVHPRRIIVHGQSLGSFTAGHVAANRDTAGAVLESSVTTTEEWVARRAGAQAARTISIDAALRGRGNSRYIASIAEPLLLIVGANDPVTPSSLSQDLYAASPLPASRKTLAIIPGAGHNDAMRHPPAAAAYRRFLDATIGTGRRRR
jgi:hypothetical protein